MSSPHEVQLNGVDVSSKPCRVTEVELNGLQRTQAHVIERELAAVHRATNLTEVYTALQDVIANWTQLDVFSSVDVSITETQRGGPDTCRVEFNFVEKTFWTLKAKSFVQGAEAGVEGCLGLRNLRGMGERVTVSMEYGSHRLRESGVEYVMPRIGGHSCNLYAKLFNFAKTNYHFTSYEERLRGLALTLASPDRSHALSYELGWHQLLDAHRQASPAILERLGHELKSSIQYQILYDPREARQLSTGGAVRWMTQLNGLLPHGSVARTVKNRLDVQLSWKWLPWSSLSIGAAAGLVMPLTRAFRTTQTSIAERFHLGGVDSLKGFHTYCLGPSMPCRSAHNATPLKRARDYLGGDAMASAYVSLNLFQRSVPRDRMGIYARVFGDVGNVATLSSLTSGPLGENLKRFAAEHRASIGAGIVLPTPLGNFELNYVLPMRFGKNDNVRSGLQMSFGTEPFTA